MPAGYGVGDHRLFVIDFLTTSLIGNAPPRIVRAQARLLNTNIPQAAEKYVNQFETTIIQHKIIQRLGAAHESSPNKAVVKERVDAVDKELKQYMVNAETWRAEKLVPKSLRHIFQQLPYVNVSRLDMDELHIIRLNVRLEQTV